MKRLAALALAGALCLGLASCGKTPAPAPAEAPVTTEAPTTIGYNTTEELQALFEGNRALFLGIADEVMKYTTLSVYQFNGKVTASIDSKQASLDPRLKMLAEDYFALVGEKRDAWIVKRTSKIPVPDNPKAFLQRPLLEFQFNQQLEGIQAGVVYSPEFRADYFYVDLGGGWYIYRINA